MSDGKEDRRVVEYRRGLESQSLIASLRVSCGFLGLFALFFAAIITLSQGTEHGLFDGGTLTVVKRFVKLALFGAGLWGLFEPWTDYVQKSTEERERRNEVLARMKQDPERFERELPKW